MQPADWVGELRSAAKRRAKRRRQIAQRRAAAWTRPLPRLAFESLEDRSLFAIDFGDAPDLGLGTGPGDYNTLAADNGPRHTIVAGLFMGASVDGDANGAPNAAANGDDKFVSPAKDDEDGLISQATDLTLTIGAQPKVHVLVTNTTGTGGTLYGWIDYNDDGEFNSGTERAQISVPTGTTKGIVTLTFPTVPQQFTGTTYARFRLSTDMAAANPTGPAFDGEVEDYVATITAPSKGTVQKSVEIASGLNGGPTIGNRAFFGRSITSLGDLDGDGVADLAVGASYDNTGGNGSGAVHILFMNSNGSVKGSTEIASGTTDGPTLASGDYFGKSVAALGDLDGDGVCDLAVGAIGTDVGLINRVGAVYVIFLNSNGTPKSSVKITHNTGGGPTLTVGDEFGTSIAPLGDLDGDGVVDLAVGTVSSDIGGSGAVNRGAVYVLFMKSDGTAKSSAVIGSNTGGGPILADGDFFGRSVAALGDLDGDGISDLAVGAYGDDTGGANSSGAVYVFLMNSNGTVKSQRKIANDLGGGPTLSTNDSFGISMACLGDLNGDGIADLGVGAQLDNAVGFNRGAAYVIFMNPNGTVKLSTKLASGIGGAPTFSDQDYFGGSIAALGDINGDGVADLAVGAPDTNVGGSGFGAMYVLYLNPTDDFGDAPAPFPTLLVDNGARHTAIGATLGATRDFDFDGQPDPLALGDDTAGHADEDGFVTQSPLIANQAGSVTVNVQGVTGTYFLSAWIDFNRDGDWADPGEKIASDFAVTTSGDKVLNFTSPANTISGTHVARFRFSTATGLSVRGPAPDGEVEDHLLNNSARPTAIIGGATSVDEGQSIVLDGSGSSDPNGTINKYEWDLDFNGTFHLTNNGATPTFNSVGLSGPLTRTVALRVTNSFGVQSLLVKQDITVNNLPPSISSLTIPATGRFGVPTVLSATADDPAGPVDPLTFTWTITRPNATTFTLTGKNPVFSPDAIGPFGVSLTVMDDDLATAIGGGTIDVGPGPGNLALQMVTDAAHPKNKQLVITGDDQFNEFALDLGAGGFPNTLRLRGLNGTLINGSPAAVGLNGFTSIVLDMQGGNDIVTVNGGNITGQIVLEGGDGDDTFILSTTKTKFVLDDTGGTDLIDFSNSPQGVKLDLSKQRGETQNIGGRNSVRLIGQFENLIGSRFNDTLKGNTADNLIRGGGGNDILTGGGGNNALLGEAGNDKLSGSAGFDLLIGGDGRDQLTSGPLGNSLLIGGTTAHDSSDAALLSILSEWSRTSGGSLLSIDIRIAHLTTPNVGGLNGGVVLTSSGTVIDDFAVDSIKGLVGGNWFFSSPNDKLRGKLSTDRP